MERDGKRETERERRKRKRKSWRGIYLGSVCV